MAGRRILFDSAAAGGPPQQNPQVSTLAASRVPDSRPPCSGMTCPISASPGASNSTIHRCPPGISGIGKINGQYDMKLRHALSVAMLAAAGIAAPAVGVAPAAHADTLICDQYGSTTIGGRYVVMNNRWGSNATQCINVTNNGFQIQTQQGSTSGGAPLSYPAIYLGCHYANCSPGTNLPRQLSQIGNAPSSISYNYTGGTFDASYDIWMDPTAKTTGVNQMELMIWFNRTGGVQPVGSRVGTTTIGGRSWEVWQGNNGGNDVLSYVAQTPIASWSFNVMDFVNDVDNRTRVDRSWYLTSIQAGFEPWNGGVGLAVNSFSANVN